MHRVLLHLSYYAIQNRMQKLNLKSFAELVTISQLILKVYNQLQLLIEFVMQKFEYFENVFAYRQFLFFGVEYYSNIFFDLLFDLFFFGLADGCNWKVEGKDIFDLHELFFAGHIESSSFLNGIVNIFFCKFGVNLYFSPGINSRVAVHFSALLNFFFVVGVVVDDVVNSVTKIDKNYNNQKFETVFGDVSLYEFFLISPV